MRRSGQALWRNDLHVDLERGRVFAPWAQFFAIFEQNVLSQGPFWDQYELFLGQIGAEMEHAVFCRTAEEAKTVAEMGKVAAFLSVEGAELLNCDLDKLAEAHRLGVRMVTLTWNHANALSGAHMDASGRGLSELGRRFVRTCQDLGVIVDVSHLSEPGFWDVAEEMEGPFVASHSNSKAVWSHSRNLTDAQFLAIVKAGGVAGINLYSKFVGDDPDVDDVIAHVEHFWSLGGERSVAMGADLDGCDALPRGIVGIQDLEQVAEGLLRRNYGEGLVRDLFYNNLLRVVETVCSMTNANTK
ncbi:MAG: membrane dipeptidase [Oscillospiraceae bacterium]|nr:membrane dipeptidase [Oscillospiraceae bacterium]